VSSGCFVAFDEDHHGGVYAVLLIWCLGSFFFVFVLVVAGVGGR
jgi:hypothetical protein